MRYRKRAETVLAELWIGHGYNSDTTVLRPLMYRDIEGPKGRAQEIVEGLKCHVCNINFMDHVEVQDLRVPLFVCPNSWIVTEKSGNKLVLTPSEFISTY